MTKFNTDQYGEYYNGQLTYDTISELLMTDKVLYIGWIDEDVSHHDILFAIPEQYGIIQNGIRSGDLHVAIHGFGHHAFDINPENIFPGYISEKLQYPMGLTNEKLTDLINGVRLSLHRHQNRI